MDRRQLIKSLVALSLCGTASNIAKWLAQGGVYGEEFILEKPIVFDCGGSYFEIKDCIFRQSRNYVGPIDGPIIDFVNNDEHVLLENIRLILSPIDCDIIKPRNAHLSWEATMDHNGVMCMRKEPEN